MTGTKIDGNLAPMDADHRKRDDRLSTIAEVAATVRVPTRARGVGWAMVRGFWAVVVLLIVLAAI